MTRQELIDYCKDVFELEKQIYAYRQIRKEYDKKLVYVGVPQPLVLFINDNGIPVISGEHLEKTEKPEWLQTKEFKEIDSIKPNTQKGARIIISSVFMLICALIIIFILSTVGFFGLVWLALPIYIIWSLLSLIIDFKIPIKDLRFEGKKEKKKKYFNKCKQKEALIIAEKEKPLKRHIEKEYVELIIKPKERAQTLLNKLYSHNLILPKYRNFVSIAQIYEYLASGRCYQLEGPDGAYGLYERELRQNIIVDRLNEIIRQLPSFNVSMSTLCGAIETIKRLLCDVSSALGRIETNIALSDYNSQCIANNTNIANRYNY